MKKIKILIADKIDLSGIGILPHAAFDITTRPGISNKQIILSFSKYDVLIINSKRTVDKDLLSCCNFKFVATCSRGTDHISTSFAKRKKITIINSSGANAISAAEHTMAMILTIYKNILLSNTIVKKNNFENDNFKRNEIYGKKIGIIGIGQVGSLVAKYCRAFGMQVFANDIDPLVKKKYPELIFKPLNFILKNSDIISIHIPLNRFNTLFIDSRKLNKISNNCLLINTSRGKIINEKCLIKLLQQNKIYFAGLDVFVNEPDINEIFLKLPNVFLTNHIAGKTEESKIRMSNDIFLQIKNSYI